MEQKEKIPASVAIIMDGNGRWALAHSMERPDGHKQGVKSVRRVVEQAIKRGVKWLTLYTFSTENWGRPQQEVDAIMTLLTQSIASQAEELQHQGVRVVTIGDLSPMSDEVRRSLDYIRQLTVDGQKLTLVLALNYSSRSEIAHAMRQIAQDVTAGKIKPSTITPELIEQRLYTAGMPSPDLIIRTGGELRLSNFMLWQGAYSELYFTPVLWPDFSQEDFDRALEAYSSRQRRYGLLLQDNE